MSDLHLYTFGMIKLCNEALRNRYIIWSLAKNDIRSRYLGSILGAVWFFLLPLVNIIVIWFAFEFGLRAGVQNGVPVILWLISGMVPWAFFSESVSTAAASIVEKPFLVKKILFNVELLPLIKIVASMVSFIFLSIVLIVTFVAYGFRPSIYWLQFPYFVFCLFALALSLSWISSALVVFYRDLGQLISVGLQVGFWITPIVWSPEMLPEKFGFINDMNPMAYVIGGLRGSLFGRSWFWDAPGKTLFFWLIVGGLFYAGLRLFRKLRPHFADLL